MKINTLHDALVHEMRDLYSAEVQLTKALPRMAKAASHEELVARPLRSTSSKPRDTLNAWKKPSSDLTPQHAGKSARPWKA
jgi:Domain of unknown function (DUF892)